MRRRRIGMALIFGAAVPLVIASTAWACGVLATLQVNTKAAAPGQTVTVTGNNYSSSAAASDVSIRLNSRKGGVLATTKPATGFTTINTPVQLPAGVKVGWHVLVATQTVNGVPKAGTPGRTTLRIQGAARGRRSSEAPFAPLGSSKPAGPGGSGGAVASSGGDPGAPTLPTLLGIAAAVMLLGTGVTLVGRSRTSTATNRPLLGA